MPAIVAAVLPFAVLAQFDAPPLTLQRAAWEGDFATVKAMIDVDPELVHDPDEENRTPLHGAGPKRPAFPDIGRQDRIAKSVGGVVAV